ncbi:DNA helicase-2 / ATP-dependent DNA helicase PcrA [Pseudobutyrivibrio sp. YE44]|uniref:ATP-dependent helicase n=1 Tax=Pseudobutyrivibrio sp. YE44 TaxID=1520802 RepID=UPI0008807638|nr:UvrD-helicase domain-containing protein [Pseudobutyrivibrio sp. YE44]SDB48419.1 DNA helicase-2 / ATP-dependent DNA helicase PcrA [Pseudobutyrivibrio sp. YE44]
MDLSMLNDKQREGVETIDGPVLILAGAGSGKTRVLTHRVAYLIEQGVMPYNIMAITFTNKAAREMRERIDNIVGFGSDGVWVATFHASCVRILRRFGERLGYGSNFTIYDTDDCKTLMKEVCKYLQIDTKQFKERTFLNVISDAKNKLIGPEEFTNRAMGDFNMSRQATVYREYQARLRQNNAFDFDDLIMKTVELLKMDSEVQAYYQNKFHYIMVDEYQDTNAAQFELVRLLSSGRENLCVVGDDDQSIYKFRGADIYNILNFEQHFPNAHVIKLEQNYRSTGNILDAANSVIANNEGRKEKALWTEAEAGDKIEFQQFDSAYEEASYIASNIASYVRKGEADYRDCAVLYRTNAQSRLIEEKMIYEGIPYKIVGGVNFYSRKEIKDVLAYLKTVDNGSDDIAVQRIINIPKRGIGATTISKVSDFARERGLNFYEALVHCEEIPSLGKAATKIQGFTGLIEKLRKIADEESVSALVEEILDQTDYVAELKAEGTDEAKARIENIDELLTKAVAYEKDARLDGEEPTLSGFLEDVALVADIDSYEESDNYVVLMTLHGAKGLEFPRVYMAGMEDGLFPGQSAIFDGGGADSEMEEERRLAYVGITRAREHLTMTSARMRMVRGETAFHKISRFVKEIPEDLLHGNLWEPKPMEDYSSTPIGEYSVYQKPTGFGKPFLGTTYGSSSGSKPTSSFNGGSSYSKPASFTVGSSTTAVANKNGTKIEKGELEYGIGDRVSHIKFKEGTVKDIIDEGRDYEVTVEFDGVGVKKMFASFAKLKKV